MRGVRIAVVTVILANGSVDAGAASSKQKSGTPPWVTTLQKANKVAKLTVGVTTAAPLSASAASKDDRAAQTERAANAAPQKNPLPQFNLPNSDLRLPMTVAEEGKEKNGQSKQETQSAEKPAGENIVPEVAAPTGDEKAPSSDKSGDSAKAKALPAAAAKGENTEPSAKTSEIAGGTEEDRKRTASYCLNIANAALDARYVLQKNKLEQLKTDIQSRTVALEKKISELEGWYTKREQFIRKARENLVAIFASMKAEAAAKQLSDLDEETAAALIAKIDARQSSAILSEMDSKKAARLTEFMAGAVQVDTGVKKSGPSEETAAPAVSPQGSSETNPAKAVKP